MGAVVPVCCHGQTSIRSTRQLAPTGYEKQLGFTDSLQMSHKSIFWAFRPSFESDAKLTCAGQIYVQTR